MVVELPSILQVSQHADTHTAQFRSTQDSFSEDLGAAVESMAKVAEFLSYSARVGRRFPQEQTNAAVGALLQAVINANDHGMFTAALNDESNGQNRHALFGTMLSELARLPGVAAFTTAPEAFAAAARDVPMAGPSDPSPRAAGKPPAKPIIPARSTKRPPPPPSAQKPEPKTFASRAKAAAALVQPISVKRKANPKSLRDEAVVALARTFPDADIDKVLKAQGDLTGRPDAPTEAERLRAKRRRHTTYGQSRRAFVVYSTPPANWQVEKIMSNINQELARQKRSVKVESAEDIRGALTMVTSVVPDEDDLKILQTLFETSYKAKIAAGEMTIRVEIPSSKSCLKINDFPYYNGFNPENEPVKWTGESLKKVLDQSPYGREIKLYNGSMPRISRNSRKSDTGTVWFDIHDSRGGLSAQNLAKKTFMYGHHHLRIMPAEKVSGLPLCQRCWRFGHRSDAKSCPFRGVFCARCGEPHRTENHRQFANCCKANPKADPPIAANTEATCSHAPRCVNCGKAHRSDDPACKFWKSRFDHQWIWKRYHNAKVSPELLKFESTSNNTPNPVRRGGGAGLGSTKIQFGLS